MSKKVSFNMTEENAKKIETLVGETNLSMTDVINQAIAKAKVITASELNTYEILNNKALVLTEATVAEIEQHFNA